MADDDPAKRLPFTRPHPVESSAPMSPPDRSREGNFYEYRHLIMESLERLATELAGLRSELDDRNREMNMRLDALRRNDLEAMKIDIAMLKTKASMWGAFGGLLGGAVISALISKFVH